MLKRVAETSSPILPQQAAAHSIVQVVSTSPVISVMRRQWPMIATVTLLSFLIGIAYILAVAPRFTASTTLMIDLRNSKAFQSGQPGGDVPVESGVIDSHVEVLKSESVALAVVRDLKLTDDPEFVGRTTSSVVGALMSLLDVLSFARPSPHQIERRAVRVFAQNLAVRRVALSHVIVVSYSSNDRDKAAAIANAIASAYMTGELAARYQATQRASGWLQDRVIELRAQTTAAEAAAQRHKAEHNIIDTPRGLLSEQQLSDVNAQIVAARAATAEARARLERIEQMSRDDLPDATVTDALRNDVITRLRGQYLDMSARSADWASRYAPTHIAVVQLRKNMQEIRRSIADELRRIAETYRSDYAIAQAREKSLEGSLSSLVSQAATTGQAQIRLRELESAAQTYRSIHDNFLQRLTDATQQQSFPMNEARVITAATAPLQKSWPINSYVLVGSAMLGLFASMGGAFLLEHLDTLLRTPQQVEQAFGLKCLGTMPTVGGSPAGPDGRSRQLAVAPGRMMHHVIHAPFSRFAETLRNVRFAADSRPLDDTSRVIGVTSALSGEGKTTIAANLAALIARSGARVLLIDADMRNPALTRLMMPDARDGLLDVLTGRRRLQDVIRSDRTAPMDVLPAVLAEPVAHTSDLIASRAMAAVLHDSRILYDYIVLDLPPAAPVIDVRAAATLIDGFLIVVEWGRTSRHIIQSAITGHDEIRSRALGIVLNKADAASLKRIEESTGAGYSQYYHS